MKVSSKNAVTLHVGNGRRPITAGPNPFNGTISRLETSPVSIVTKAVENGFAPTIAEIGRTLKIARMGFRKAQYQAAQQICQLANWLQFDDVSWDRYRTEIAPLKPKRDTILRHLFQAAVGNARRASSQFTAVKTLLARGIEAEEVAEALLREGGFRKISDSNTATRRKKRELEASRQIEALKVKRPSPFERDRKRDEADFRMSFPDKRMRGKLAKGRTYTLTFRLTSSFAKSSGSGTVLRLIEADAGKLEGKL